MGLSGQRAPLLPLRYEFALAAAAALLLSGTAAWLALRFPNDRISFGLWSFALVVLLWAAVRQERVKLRPLFRLPGSRAAWLEIFALVMITLLAFGLRAYDLTYRPAHFHGDEGEMGVMAVGILEGKPTPPFATGWGDHPNLFYYMQAVSLMVWGRTEAGLRMLSVLWGTANVPLIYLLGRTGWGRAAGFTAAWLLAVSHLHIHFSRLGLNNIHSATAMLTLVLLFALAYARTSRSLTLLLVTAGLTLGLSQYLYFGSWLLPVVAVPLLWWLWRSRRVSVGGLAALLAAFLVAYLPLGWYFANHWDIFTNRSRTVSIFSAEIVRHTLGPSASLPSDWQPLFQHQIVQNFRFFAGDGDRSSFYAAELAPFDPLTLLLFWAGFASALLWLSRFYDRSLLLWFGAGVVLAGVLTRDSPNAPRLILTIPAVFALAGVFVQHVWNMARRRSVFRWQVAVPLFVLAAAYTLAVNVRTYFIEYDRFTYGIVPVNIARAMIYEPASSAIFLAGAPNLYANHGAIQFLAKQAGPSDLEDTDQLAEAYQAGMGLLVIAVPERAGELEAIGELFPGGILSTAETSRGYMLYAAYRVPPGARVSPLDNLP